MSPEERARRVAQSFRESPDKSTRVLLDLVTQALREAVLEERNHCLKAMYTGLDLDKVERAVRSRAPRA